MDIVSEKQRSYNMSRIRGRDTKPERLVRSMLHRAGYRFTVNGPKNKNLPGRPDIVLPRIRTVIFVHGCFWHAHEGCKNFRLPKTRAAWWKEKIEGNAKRDRGNVETLNSLGWKILVVWECSLATEKNRIATEKLLSKKLADLARCDSATPQRHSDNL